MPSTTAWSSRTNPSGFRARLSQSSAQARPGWPWLSNSAEPVIPSLVYERDDAVGGLLRYGIPEFKMEKAVLDRRLVQLRGEGIRFSDRRDDRRQPARTTSRSPSWLSRFDAVVMATDHPARALPFPGSDLSGVYPAMDYLVPANREALGATGDLGRGQACGHRGRGDTGADLLRHRASVRGAASVTQLDIRPQPPPQRTEAHPWPMYPLIHRVGESHEEGGERVFGVNTVEALNHQWRGQGDPDRRTANALMAVSTLRPGRNEISRLTWC